MPCLQDNKGYKRYSNWGIFDVNMFNDFVAKSIIRTKRSFCKVKPKQQCDTFDVGKHANVNSNQSCFRWLHVPSQTFAETVKSKNTGVRCFRVAVTCLLSEGPISMRFPSSHHAPNTKNEETWGTSLKPTQAINRFTDWFYSHWSLCNTFLK